MFAVSERDRVAATVEFANLWDSQDDDLPMGPPTPQKRSPAHPETPERGKRRRLCNDEDCCQPYKTDFEERCHHHKGKSIPHHHHHHHHQQQHQQQQQQQQQQQHHHHHQQQQPQQPPPQHPSFSIFFNATTSISSSILNICTAANRGVSPLKKEDRCRLQFLRDTVDLIVSFSSAQRDEVKALPQFLTLFEILTARMVDVSKMLQRIERMESTITENFDIFELKLRSYLEELKALFPPNGFPASSLGLISDEGAKMVWARYFGESAFVTFGRFVHMLESEQILPCAGSEENRTGMFLRYFANFPVDDVVTTYKWNQLVCLFGPLDRFANNFQSLVMGKGFLGLINRIQAFEILTLTHRPRTLLIRTSRTEPQFLAFSYKDAEGKIAHRLNKDRYGQLVPVEEFMRTRFSGYELVDQGLDVQKIFGVEKFADPLTQYASESGGYYL